MAAESRPLSLSAVDVGEAEIAAAAAVLRSGRLSIGPQQEAFEAEFAAAVGSRHAAAVSSGTAALHLTLLACGIGPGDEVIVPAFTFIAPVNAVRYVGATPVLVDADGEDLGMSADRVAAAIGPRTRAVIPVHVFGAPAPLVDLVDLAAERRLFLLEDACEGVGGALKGRMLGSWGDAGVFGFYPNKQMTTGEGGMVVTDDAELDAALRRLRNHGRDPGESAPHRVLGYNQRLPEISCAVGRVQLRRLPELIERRAAVAGLYDERLRGLDAWRLPRMPGADERRSWFVYVIRYRGLDPAETERIRRALAADGIATGRYFPPVHLQPDWDPRWGRPGEFPVAEDAGTRTLALPFHPGLTPADVDRVCARLRRHTMRTG